MKPVDIIHAKRLRVQRLPLRACLAAQSDSSLTGARFKSMLMTSAPNPLAVWLSVITRQYRECWSGEGEGDNYEKAPAGVIVGAASGDRLPPSVVWESPAVLLPLCLLLRSLQTRLSVRQFYDEYWYRSAVFIPAEHLCSYR